MLSKEAPKARRFRTWSICLLVVVISASSVLVIHLGTRRSEPFISVNLVRTNVFGTTIEATNMELSNRMSFDVRYWVEAEPLDPIDSETGMLGSSKLYLLATSSALEIPAHTKTTNFIIEPYAKLKLSVWYVRKLKPIEISTLNKYRWLKRYYPFPRRRSFTIYEPVYKFRVSGHQTHSRKSPSE